MSVQREHPDVNKCHFEKKGQRIVALHIFRSEAFSVLHKTALQNKNLNRKKTTQHSLIPHA